MDEMRKVKMAFRAVSYAEDVIENLYRDKNLHFDDKFWEDVFYKLNDVALDIIHKEDEMVSIDKEVA